MILDSGICSIYREVNCANGGNTPRPQSQRIYSGWFGTLNFSSDDYGGIKQADVQKIDLRIRIHQCAEVTGRDKVSADGKIYEIVRVYHGFDNDNQQPISDLSLVRYEYDSTRVSQSASDCRPSSDAQQGYGRW
jgi:hypothetical protein